MDNTIKEMTEQYEIIDTHLHLGVLGYMHVLGQADQYALDLMEKYHIKGAVFSHHGALCSLQFGWEKTLQALDMSNKLYAYVAFNPNFSRFGLDLMEKHLSRKRFLGVKIHPSWHHCYPYHEKYRRFWEYADQNSLVVLTHSWNPHVANPDQKYSDPFFFADIAKKYKNVKLILAHAGGRGAYIYKVLDLLKENKNLYVDFAGDILVPGLLEKYVNAVGSERILFGTDMPWTDIRYHLLWVGASNITQEDKRNIFGFNAKKLFNII